MWKNNLYLEDTQLGLLHAKKEKSLLFLWPEPLKQKSSPVMSHITQHCGYTAVSKGPLCKTLPPISQEAPHGTFQLPEFTHMCGCMSGWVHVESESQMRLSRLTSDSIKENNGQEPRRTFSDPLPDQQWPVELSWRMKMLNIHTVQWGDPERHVTAKHLTRG